MLDFTQEEMAAAFGQIAEHYFNRNFGSMSKANLDILMFSIFYEHCLGKRTPTDDYTLSKALGISQTRIRTLKQNKQLQYPLPENKFHWKEEFARNMASARFDKKSGMVKMTIRDVNVSIELRHFLEANDLFDEYQLNPKLFQCALDNFLELCSLLENERIEFDRDELMKIREEASDSKVQVALDTILSGEWKSGIKSLVTSSAQEVLADVIESLPFVGGVAKEILAGLCDAIRKSRLNRL